VAEIRRETAVRLDVVLEMSGAESAIHQAFEMTTNGGRVSLLGLPSRPVTLDSTTRSSSAACASTASRPRAVATGTDAALLREGLDVSPIITHRCRQPLCEAFDLLAKASPQVVLLPQEGAIASPSPGPRPSRAEPSRVHVRARAEPDPVHVEPSPSRARSRPSRVHVRIDVNEEARHDRSSGGSKATRSAFWRRIEELSGRTCTPMRVLSSLRRPSRRRRQGVVNSLRTTTWAWPRTPLKKVAIEATRDFGVGSGGRTIAGDMTSTNARDRTGGLQAHRAVLTFQSASPPIRVYPGGRGENDLIVSDRSTRLDHRRIG